MMTLLPVVLLLGQLNATTPPPLVPVEELPVEKPEGGRFRWGASVNLGVHLPFPAFAWGVTTRLGYQVSEAFGIYVAPSFIVASNGKASDSIQLEPQLRDVTRVIEFGNWNIAVMAEGALHDRLFLAGGIGIGFGHLLLNTNYAVDAPAGEPHSAASKGNLGRSFAAETSVTPLAKVSLSYTVIPVTKKRRGFTVGIDVLTVFNVDGEISDTRTSPLRTALLVSLVPSLTLGFDAR